MNGFTKCPECGTELPANVPPGSCPKCLLRLGLGGQPGQENGGIVRKLPVPGQNFGHFAIIRTLGKGAMGVVYEAQDLDSGRRVALKVLNQKLDSPKDRKRFLREGQLAASINHPNCVYVFGTEEIDGVSVISMELASGGTLQDVVKARGPMPAPKAVDAILQIIAGLEAAASVGVLHRDVKPANCFVSADGTIKVGDFGLSISASSRNASDSITRGYFAGTPAICAPEQLRGEESSVRSDIYAVGVTLYYLLTGRIPFEARNPVQLIAMVLEKRAESPSKLRRDIPKGLSKVVLRCMEKSPSERFSGYAELRQALQPYCSNASTPATLGLRLIAGFLDGMVLSPILTCLFIFEYAYLGMNLERATRYQAFLFSVCGFSIQLIGAFLNQ